MKKGAIVITIVSIILFGAFAFSAFSAPQWHPLQWIANDTAGSKSVDSNNNGIIDEADNAHALNGVDGSTILAKLNAQSGGSSGGGSSEGFTYTIVLVPTGPESCPNDFTKVSLGSLQGYNNYDYVVVTKDNAFFGGLYNWDWRGTNGFKTRIPSSWGYLCFKKYSVNKVSPPTATVLGVPMGLSCDSLGAGYHDFKLSSGVNNGYTHIIQTSYGLYIGMLDYWSYYNDAPTTEDMLVTQWYHTTHVGHTCWRVDNVNAATI